MILSPDEMNAIKGLVHYLNENFDGHGMEAEVFIRTTDEHGMPKGTITAVEHEISIEDGAAMLTYAWGTGDD